MKVILASKSPRRKELLDLIKVRYEVQVCEEEEIFEKGLSIEEQSQKVAYTKAKTIFDQTKEDRIIIGADTIVVLNGKIYGKPENKEQAETMLLELKNQKHQVITSIAVLIQEGENYQEYKEAEVTNVYFKDYTKEEVTPWIQEGKVLDRAGAYGVQDSFCKFIKKIDGDYFSVVGLPIGRIYDLIKKYDVFF